MPTAQNLHSASRGGENREKPKRGELTLDLVMGEELAYTINSVGAGLPAMAFDQAMNMSNDTPLSLASQLLQGTVTAIRAKPKVAVT